MQHLLVIRHSEFVIHTGAMLDIRLIREKPDFVRERLATRNGGDDAKIDEEIGRASCRERVLRLV